MAVECRTWSSCHLVPLLRWSVHPMHFERLPLLRDSLQSQGLISSETATHAPDDCIHIATPAGRGGRCCSRGDSRRDRAIR